MGTHSKTTVRPMPKQQKLLSEALAEGIGTFALVFAGTGAVMVNSITGGALTHLGISFVFGAVVAAMIYATGHISGAHFNPAVTLGFWSGRVLPTHKLLPYLLGQLGGGILASFFLRIALGNVASMGATMPLDDNWLQSLVLETILTFILMFVILGSGLDRRAPVGFAGAAIGLTVGLEAAFMGPITGASMNPVRSLAPALIGNLWQHQWLYVIGPILGGQIAVWVYRQLTNDFHDFKHSE